MVKKRERSNYNRQWRLAHKEQVDEITKRFKEKHPNANRDFSRKWRELYPNRRQREVEKQIERNRQLKKDTLQYYGGEKCACVICGFDDIRALSLDHIESNGRKHRNTKGIGSGSSLYRWLKKQNYPSGYQTLCMNCQFIKRVEKKEYHSRYEMDGIQPSEEQHTLL